MARTKLNAVIAFLESQFNTDSLFRSNVFFTYMDDAIPPIAEYGVHIYLVPGFHSKSFPYIGNIMKEIYRVNVDVIINKHRTRRKNISDTNFISDLIDTTQNLLLHKTNSNTFVDTNWEPQKIETEGDSQIIPGIFTVEINNIY